jgi:hypothetical protein
MFLKNNICNDDNENIYIYQLINNIGLMEERENWFMMDAEEPSKNCDEEDEKEEKRYFRIFKTMEHCGDAIRLRKKKMKDEEEDIEEQYNVSVYQVLPYPPNTKDVKDFFVQRN